MKKITSLFLALLLFSNPAFATVSSVERAGSGGVSDTAYDASSWDGVTTIAPSKNAVRDKLEALTLGGAVDDTAYSSSWNGVTTIAPSKNAVYDKLQAYNLTVTPYVSGAAVGSVALGSSVLVSDAAPGNSFNVGIGNYALKSITTGTHNTGVGYNAVGGATDSQYNTGIGDSALSGPLTTAAIKNTIVGANSGISMTDGTLNVGIGYHTMVSTTTGSSNTSVGVDALYENITGGSNTAIGGGALVDAISATPNTAVGQSSLGDTTTGGNNTALGYRAGKANTTGSSNVWIGDESGYQNSFKASTNQILIGAATSANSSNIAVIGTSATTGFGVGMSAVDPPTFAFTMLGTGAKTVGMQRNTSDNSAGNNLTVNAGGSTTVGAINTMSSTPTAGGTGYTVGDILTISTGGANALAHVNTVSGGAVTSITRITRGSGYSTGTGQATTGGTGTGCTVNITGVFIGTDKAGGNLILQSGISTGTGASSILMKVPALGTTGTTDNALTTYGTVDYNGFRATPPSAQTIAAGNVITADACGGLKQVTSAGAVTTDTTNTFTASAAGTTGCFMTVINTGTQNITLDNNAEFHTLTGLDIVLAGKNSVLVASNGSEWYQVGLLVAAT